jgi:hypothetical protein
LTLKHAGEASQRQLRACVGISKRLLERKGAMSISNAIPESSWAMWTTGRTWRTTATKPING